MRDNWCIGYSRKYTVGVWTGNFSGDPMWNVSGVTGAAPLWMEIMDFLHRGVPSIKQEASSGLVRKKDRVLTGRRSVQRGMVYSRDRTQFTESGNGEFNPRILYPPSGTVLAVDPDIPPELQKVFFVSQVHEDHCQWLLNGATLKMTGRTIPWIPKAGKYHLAIADEDEKVLDYVYFEVRGSGAD